MEVGRQRAQPGSQPERRRRVAQVVVPTPTGNPTRARFGALLAALACRFAGSSRRGAGLTERRRSRTYAANHALFAREGTTGGTTLFVGRKAGPIAARATTRGAARAALRTTARGGRSESADRAAPYARSARRLSRSRRSGIDAASGPRGGPVLARAMGGPACGPTAGARREGQPRRGRAQTGLRGRLPDCRGSRSDRDLTASGQALARVGVAVVERDSLVRNRSVSDGFGRAVR